MIEINLLPGSPKRAKRKAKLAIPAFNKPSPGLPTFDRLGTFLIAAWVMGPVLVGWLYLGSGARIDQLAADIQGAQADSARYAEIRVANDILRARQDTIAQKLQIIQEIDASRFVWSHILDEVSRSLPEYTWLRTVTYVSADAPLNTPTFRIEGRTGNTFALTQFMQNLEASPFVRGVTLVTTDQIVEDNKSVYSFMLDAKFEEPPPEVIQTVPLFGTQEGY
jgi:type IV pilus assembly protein PilN